MVVETKMPIDQQPSLEYPSLARPSVPTPTLTPPPAVAPAESPFGNERRSLRKRLGSMAAAIAAMAAKFATAVKAGLLALPNLKLLTTAGTAMVSVAAYALIWGWSFAAGFVLLLFVHEMGHVFQLRREGVKASSPMFIPFLGAVIAARTLGDNALAEARVGLAGPVLGSLGAFVCLIAGELMGSQLLLALAYVGFFLNLFNLIPMLPLDGGRAMAAMAPWMWFVGLAAMVPLLFLFPNGYIILIILLFGARELWRRWQLRKTRTLEQAAYYRVSPRARLAVATVYVGLIVLLAAGMDAAYVARTIS
jgi:Zn-dependent protease